MRIGGVSGDLRCRAAAIAIAALVSAGSALHAGTVHEVRAEHSSFVPADITVAPGDTIRWIYVSGDFHTVTSGVDCVADNLLFNEFLHPGAPEFLYEVPAGLDGVIDYFCIPHCGNNMVATFTVVPDDACSPADLDDDGQIAVTDLLSMRSAWGPCAGCPQDLNDDDIVNVIDLLALLAGWGACG